MSRRGFDRRRRHKGRSAYGCLKNQAKTPIEPEPFAVPGDLKGHLIGKGGCVIKEIISSSGAQIRSPKGRDEDLFLIIGTTEQRECAKKLITKKVEEIRSRMSKGPSAGNRELVEVPDKFKGLVIGKNGDNLRHISTITGARVTTCEREIYVVSGTDEQRERAKVQIRMKISGARLRGLENEFKKTCYFINGWNLPEDCKLKLEQAQTEDRLLLTGPQGQYRLRPAEDYELQDSCAARNDQYYLPILKNEVLECLREIKRQMKAKDHMKLDMWCHFGAALIRGPDEEEADDGEWTIEEVIEKFQQSSEGILWRTALNQGVHLDETFFEEHVARKTSEEYIARYDLTYLTPGAHEIRCKVWIAKNDNSRAREDLESIEIPFSDVKNILEEIDFEDEATRQRCRGWLVLPSRKYLLADILFPGCEFDCRLTIRGRADSAFDIDYIPKEEERSVLSRYLSGLTICGSDEGDLELCLPQLNKLNGFHLIHKRRSRRSLYDPTDGFAIILSKECTWKIDMDTEESRESTDLHLHCKEWDTVLKSGDWEPEMIADKIPEFFEFVENVQDSMLGEMKKFRNE
ncbi:uncharacterized protein [Montipora capricornis]|uniref:uncharacterized protein n=1 Tax=Montipora capricornis TaxID=246305 RepID=UPI0035F13FD5